LDSSIFRKKLIKFKPEPFHPPIDPSEQLRSLQSEISKLKTELKQTNIELNSSQKFNELLAKYKEISNTYQLKYSLSNILNTSNYK